ncbi:MAG: hypothetical protein LBG72_07140 [Spirochaetaceae bacterium]|nr:hypothetical protein [Spirochaetaceae bacterium]
MKTSIFRFLAPLYFLGLIFTSGVFAENNIAVMVVETNIAENAAGKHAAIWESGIMDFFFSEGFIVSNAQSIRIPQNDRIDFPKEALKDFQDAIQNGSDFFVLATLNYIPSSDGKSPPVLSTASLKLFRISPYRFVCEKKIDTTEAKLLLPKDEWTAVNTATQSLLPYMRKSYLTMGNDNIGADNESE